MKYFIPAFFLLITLNSYGDGFPPFSETQRGIDILESSTLRKHDVEVLKYTQAQMLLTKNNIAGFEDWLTRQENQQLKIHPKHMCELYSWAFEFGVNTLSVTLFDKYMKACAPQESFLQKGQQVQNYNFVLGNYFFLSLRYNEYQSLIESKLSNETRDGLIIRAINYVKYSELQQSLEYANLANTKLLDLVPPLEHGASQVSFWEKQASIYLVRSYLLMWELSKDRDQDIVFLESALIEADRALSLADNIEYPVLWATAMKFKADVLDHIANNIIVRATDMGDGHHVPVEGDLIDRKHAQLRAERARSISMQVL